jgi:flagellar motor switch/type III secretory pathway protein FliN
METTDQVLVQTAESAPTPPQPENNTALSLSLPHLFSGENASESEEGLDGDPDVAVRRLPTHLEQLPVDLDVRVPLPGFSMRQLLSLKRGTVLETNWLASEDLPLSCGGEQFLWIEFEAVDDRLTARITRLA